MVQGVVQLLIFLLPWSNNLTITQIYYHSETVFFRIKLYPVSISFLYTGFWVQIVVEGFDSSISGIRI